MLANSIKQLKLFSFGESAKDPNQVTFKDPAFACNKKIPLHRWVPWIAGFSSEFVRGALERHLSPKGVVIDPFAGVGTSLVEAVAEGHDAIGFEINPYAALACRAKLSAFRVDHDQLQAAILNLGEFNRDKVSNGYTPRSSPPLGFKTRGEFYSPKVLRKVLIIQDFIKSIKNDLVRDLFRLAFASTMVSYSNYSYEPSLGQRKSAGRDDVHDYPVAEVVLGKLREMAEDIAQVKSQRNGKAPQYKIYNESFFGCTKKLPAGMADLIITSPPYLNNYHYNRNTRPHLYWLGYAKGPADMKPLEEENFGKFWQTVRDSKRIDLDFKMGNSEIKQQIEALRRLNPDKGVYGGNGWANYAASYFNDCHRFAKCARHVLKRGGTALVVVGNSILQGAMIPTDRYLGEIAESAGLRLVEIHIPRATRVGNSIIQSNVRVEKAKKSHQLYEAVVELQKK